MELHSYAKRKATKKWTIEQKRKLVETRIKYDSVFGSKPTNSVIPWKRILCIAKLDDFNIFFVRKQWSNMVSKYKQYKEKCIDNKPTTSIDEEMILKITKEWEFFQPIHSFMARKTRNLHSYAADPEEEHLMEAAQKRKQQQQQEYLQQQRERVNICSSDTNEEYATVSLGDNSNSNSNAGNDLLQTQNTDHDFYTKKTAQLQQQQQQQTIHYFADISEDTQESIIQVELTTTEVLTTPPATKAPVLKRRAEDEMNKASAQIKQTKTTKNTQRQTQQQSIEGQQINTEQNGRPSYSGRGGCGAAAGASKPQLSERDKYYRHKRRYHHRLERRFDAMLNVFGQVIKAEYPSIDVSPIMGSGSADTAAAAITAGISLANRLFSSSEDDDDDSAAGNVHTSDEDGDDAAISNVHDEQAIQHQMTLEQQHTNEQ